MTEGPSTCGPENPRMGKLPDFLVIGAMKAGTTSLNHYLHLHPEIEMPVQLKMYGRNSKTTHFFNDDASWAKGEDWYRSFFPGHRRLSGEAGASYSKKHLFPLTASRVHGLLPDVKLIYVVRDPIPRLISHYLHQVAVGREQSSLEEVLDRTGLANDYVQTSLYTDQLAAFLDFFPPQQVHLACFEHLSAEPGPTLGRMFSFLNVDASFSHPEFMTRHHITADKRAPNALGRLMMRHGLAETYFNHRIVQLVAGKKLGKASLTARHRAMLMLAFEKDRVQLAACSGLRLDHWLW